MNSLICRRGYDTAAVVVLGGIMKFRNQANRINRAALFWPIRSPRLTTPTTRTGYAQQNIRVVSYARIRLKHMAAISIMDHRRR